MAKRSAPALDNIFAPTEPKEIAPPPVAAVPNDRPQPEPPVAEGLRIEPLGDIPAEGRTFVVGAGLRESEIAALDALAGQLGIARNSLMRLFIRQGLERAHLVDWSALLETPAPKKRLKLP